MADAFWIQQHGVPPELKAASLAVMQDGVRLRVILQTFEDGKWRPSGPRDGVSDLTTEVESLWPAAGHTHTPAPLGTGQHHPLIWRPGAPAPYESGLPDAFLTSASAALLLFHKLTDALTVIEPVPPHADAYGHEVRELLIAACTEFEAACSSVLRANSYAAGRWTTQDYVKLKGPLLLDEYEVGLPLHPHWPAMRPFDGWSAHAPGPTQTLPWYHAYNQTKHDREQNFQHGTLAHAINAMAAVFVMMAARFGPHAFGHLPLMSGRADFPVLCRDFVLTAQPARTSRDRLYLPRNGNADPWASVNFAF